MNLVRLAGQLARDDSGPVRLVGEHCLNYHDKAQTCQACSEICPADAIESGTPPALDVSRCERCFACLPVCPSGALTAEDDVPALLHGAEATGARRLELVCQQNGDAARGVLEADAAIRVRGCLAGLGSAALVLLAASGVEKLVVRDDACADCPWQQASGAVVDQVRAAQQMLALWRREAVIALSGPADSSWAPRPVYAASAPPLRRRDLIRRRRTTITPVDGRQPFHERLRQVQAIEMLGPPAAERARAPLALRGFALVDVDPSCTACGACSRICPTGALTLEVDEEAYRLTFAPQACIACGPCAPVCSPGALTLDVTPSFASVFGGAGVRTLQKGPVARCQRCRAPFPAATGGDYCSICEHRRQHPFTVVIPPADEQPLKASLRDGLPRASTPRRSR